MKQLKNIEIFSLINIKYRQGGLLYLLLANITYCHFNINNFFQQSDGTRPLRDFFLFPDSLFGLKLIIWSWMENTDVESNSFLLNPKILSKQKKKNLKSPTEQLLSSNLIRRLLKKWWTNAKMKTSAPEMIRPGKNLKKLWHLLKKWNASAPKKLMNFKNCCIFLTIKFKMLL